MKVKNKPLQRGKRGVSSRSEKLRNKIIVNKFGGGVMKPNFMRAAKKHIEKQISLGYKPVVVVSALFGITDKLISAYSNISTLYKNKNRRKNSEKFVNSFVDEIKEKHIKVMQNLKINLKNQKRAAADFDKAIFDLKNDLFYVLRFGGSDVLKDKILSFGEKLSAILFCLFLNSNDIFAKTFMSEEIPIVTDSSHQDANIIYDQSSKNIRKLFEKMNNIVPIINGFVGKDIKENITTLGRGGTDTTACFIGAALKALKIILWKDTDGVLSADPKIVKKAATIPCLTYEEAKESGKIIHNKAIQYAKNFDVPVKVVSISNSEKYTAIGAKSGKTKKAIKIIGLKSNLILVVITDEKISEFGFLYKVSKIFNEYKVNMVLIRNTRDSLYIVLENNNENLNKTIEILEKNYKIDQKPVDMIILIGSLDWDMVNLFNKTLRKTCSKPQLGAFPYESCVRLEAVVKANETKKIIKAFHKVFIENNLIA